MNFKRINILLLGLTVLFSTVACSKETSTKQKILIGHNHNNEHPVSQALSYFISQTNEETTSQLDFQVFGNGQLGAERDMIELVKGGVLDMAKVSSGVLEQFNPDFGIFSLPYVFESTEHFYDVMENSNLLDKISESSREKGFIVLGWYDSGSRSVYTREDIKIATPTDLKGLKIRTQPNGTSVKMITFMGGSATPMAAGETYTSLQQGIIDGAESNESIINEQGDVMKSFTYTQHQYCPDIVIMSTKTWDKLSDENKELFKESFKKSTQFHKGIWSKLIESSLITAKKYNINLYRIDKTPFINAVSPFHEEFKAKREANRVIFDGVKARLK